MKEIPRKSQSWLHFMNSLDWFTDWRYSAAGPVVKEACMIGVLESAYWHADYSSWVVREMFRENGMDSDCGDARSAYVYKCLGHKVPDSVFFPFPKLCVLVARKLMKGRWQKMEESIMRDDLACLFYSRLVVGGRLPWRMHSGVVMRSFLGCGPAAREYLSQFTAQKNGL